MSNKLNVTFLNAYIELDGACSHKFGVKTGGVTEYINRLINARFAPKRDDVLPCLVKYRNLRNRMVHEEGELDKGGAVTKSDINWIRGFAKDLAHKKDPISLYLKKAIRYTARKKLVRVLLSVLGLLLVAGGIALYFVFR